jgi:threonine synthase
MNYYSTNKHSPLVDFREATINGQAPDKGLYFPSSIPTLDAEWLNNIGKFSAAEIAFHVIRPYVGSSIPENELFSIAEQTVNFPIPLVKVKEDIYSLELFHGPTLAFKDIGARFMSRCLGYFVRGESKEVTVLVATSGDTGGAVANGFYDVPGIRVIILYPSGKVSQVQEMQLTTLGKNIHALEVNGSFDDCQRMVKLAFADHLVRRKIFLTSANSINVARWLPQQFYYFLAYRQWKEKDQPPVISVPSGNFGNICAGILAWRSGLPARHFIAACNANDIVPQYLDNGSWVVRKAIPTLSNAMDVGDPSNFSRLLELFGHSFEEIKKMVSSCSISDVETRQTIENVYQQFGYITDPHGAVGYLALQRWLADHTGQKGIFLGTAHPVKFPEAMTGIRMEIPSSLGDLMKGEKKSLKMNPEYEELKDYLLDPRSR